MPRFTKAFAMIVAAASVNILLNRLVTGPAAEKMAFVPGKTDMFQYVGMKFMKPESEFVEVTFGWKGALTKSLPTWVGFLLEKIPGRQRGALADMISSPVDVLDARSRNLPFAETGFTLIKLDSPSKTTSWSDKEDVKKFHDEMTPHLQKLYPEATRFEFANQVVRGKLMAQPIPVNGVHTDYHWNDTARELFFEKHGLDPKNKETLSWTRTRTKCASCWVSGSPLTCLHPSATRIWRSWMPVLSAWKTSDRTNCTSISRPFLPTTT